MKKGRPATLPHPAKAEAWRDAFKASVIRVGFGINLTKAMLEFLCAISDGVTWDRGRFGMLNCPNNWLASERSLCKRGLIERIPEDEYTRVDRLPREQAEAGEWACCRLTPPGKLLVELIKLCGLFVEADAAITKKIRGSRS